MKLSTTTLSALALATLAAASDVVVLTTASFAKEVLEAPETVLAEFYAPWCGHCKNLAPHYEEAATELKSKNIKLAKVDCTVEADLCQEYGIQGYPTLKVFNGGVPSEYTGPRKADGIISYMTKLSLPAVSEVTAENFNEFKGSDKVVLISFTPSGEAPKAFSTFANSHRDSFLFGHTNDAKAFGLADLPADKETIVLYKLFDEGVNVLPADLYSALTPDTFGAWIKPNAIPLLDQISPENFATYAESGIPLAYMFVDPEATEANAALFKTIEPIAAEFKGKVSFVWIDGVKFVDHGKSLNVDVDNYPGFVVQDLTAQSKFPLKGAKWDAKAVSEFVKKFVAGDLLPDVKSAAPPAKNDDGVFVLVADEYEKIVWDQGADKDMFIEFYAPWCGHCKRLAPIWDTLGEKYADVESVTIAKFDATENDVPPSEPFKITGFPTIKFRPAGSDSYIDYQGDRSLESLIEFLEENAVHSLTKRSSNESAPVIEPEAAIEKDQITEEAAAHHDEL